MSKCFMDVDYTLDVMGIQENEKTGLYQLLAVIIHLGNIEFENSGNDDAAQISEKSKHHIGFAATLLNVSSDDLMNALLFRTIDVNGSTML